MSKAIRTLMILTVFFILFAGYSTYHTIATEVESQGTILFVVPEYPYGLDPDVAPTGSVPPTSLSFLIQDERTANVYRIRSHQVGIMSSFGSGDKIAFFGNPNGICKESKEFKRYTDLPITDLTWAGMKKISPEKPLLLKTAKAGKDAT